MSGKHVLYQCLHGSHQQEVSALLARLKLDLKDTDAVYQAFTHVSVNSTFNNNRLLVYGVCFSVVH